jgi:hypothetical protein
MVCFTWEDTQRLFIFTGNLAHDRVQLAEPEMLIEIDAIAVRPGADNAAHG